jgi:hypothetical protein
LGPNFGPCGYERRSRDWRCRAETEPATARFRAGCGRLGDAPGAGDAVFVALSSCPDIHRFRPTVPRSGIENGCHGGGSGVPVLYCDRLHVTESQRWPPGDVYDAATGGIVAPMRSAPLIADGRVFVGSGSGRVYAIDLRRGKRTWHGIAGAPVAATTNFMTAVRLAAAGRTLLVPALGQLVAFR